MNTPVGIVSLATASPPHELLQTDVAEAAQAIFHDRFPHFERMAPVFQTAGIRARQSIMPMDWYLEPRGWPERTEAYLTGAVELFEAAARKALDAAEAAGLAEPLTKGSVVASDAFFPFADGLLAAAEAGATAVIQPGGSMRDDDVIAAADEHGIAMVFTGVRHFRH